MRLTFLGAAGTVTGSKYLLEKSGHRVFVDCGLFQGQKELRLRNWGALPIEPSQVDAVVLTHAHVDHSGYLPVLVRNGFKGKIFCTPATEKLCQILLPDSAKLQEEEAAYANQKGYSKHRPAMPLYTQTDAEICLRRFVPIPFEEKFEAAPGFLFSFSPAGHILGAATVKVRINGKVALFSGDLGRQNDLIMPPPRPVAHADYLILESTYGGRLHEKSDVLSQIAAVVNRTVARGGMVLVPSFAVGRAQALLYAMHRLRRERRIPAVPVYLNSPMAVSATQLMCDFREDHKLSPEECRDACNVSHYVTGLEESIELNKNRGPMVLIAASGMLTGGRVLHNLAAFAPNKNNTILFTGFQAAGTRGAAILSGERAVKVFGEMVSINAEVATIESLSAHADQGEILEWLFGFKKPPLVTYLTHGEPSESAALKKVIEEKLGWKCRIPTYSDSVEL